MLDQAVAESGPSGKSERIAAGTNSCKLTQLGIQDSTGAQGQLDQLAWLKSRIDRYFRASGLPEERDVPPVIFVGTFGGRTV